MALPKVCGIETEYGIVVRGAENNPVSASSLLINAYVAATTSRQRGRVGWDFDDEQPANDARGFSLDDVDRAGGRDDARQRRAHQRRPLLRRPRPPRDLDPGGRHRPRGRALRPGRRGDRPAQHGPRQRQARPDVDGPGRGRRLQEQLRRQGQQLRLPRELPPRPRDAVRAHRRPGHPALRHPPGVHRRRQGRLRAARRADRPRAVPAHASGPTSSRRRSGSRRPSSARSSTPATSRTATPRSTAACTSSSATPT